MPTTFHLSPSTRKHQSSVRQRWRIAPVAAIVSLLFGCSATRTIYERPAMTIPAQFSYAETALSPAIADDRWWDRFGDSQLSELIDEALQRNNDLAAAAIKVRRAQLTAGIASENRLPQLSGSIDNAANRALDGSGNGTRSTSTQLSVRYEIDLWQRLSSLEDAARWEAHATQQDMESARLSLIATTASLYWNALFLHQSIQNARDSIAYAEKTLTLVQVQYDAGEVSGLELLEARQNLAGQRAAEIQLQQQNTVNDHALALLFDGPPRAWRDLPAQLPIGSLPELASYLPAAVLARRPDLRAAEHRLRATLANGDAVRANLYPAFSLTGSLGTSSANLMKLFSQSTGGIALNIALPFLNWPTMRLNSQIAQVDYDIAVVNFRQSLYSALSEVENALAARTRNALEASLRKENLEAAQRAERLYEIRYRAGAVPLRDFLNAQNMRRSAEIQLAQNQKQSLDTMMTLYKALGGAA